MSGHAGLFVAIGRYCMVGVDAVGRREARRFTDLLMHVELFMFERDRTQRIIP